MIMEWTDLQSGDQLSYSPAFLEYLGREDQGMLTELLAEPPVLTVLNVFERASNNIDVELVEVTTWILALDGRPADDPQAPTVFVIVGLVEDKE